MFAPDQPAAARELLRVCRPSGAVVMANWDPSGAVGQFFGLVHGYAEPSPSDDGPTPLAWGDPEHVTALLRGADVHTEGRRVRVEFAGPAEALCAHYLRYFPPLVATLAGLDPARAADLRRDLTAFFTDLDTGPVGGPACYEYEYLLVRARKPVRP
jgi:hypothetical protein